MSVSSTRRSLFYSVLALAVLLFGLAQWRVVRRTQAAGAISQAIKAYNAGSNFKAHLSTAYALMGEERA